MKQTLRGLICGLATSWSLTTWAQPVLTPDQAVMRLDEIGVYSIGYAYRGQAEQEFPLGWSGFFEDHTGVACLPFGEQKGRHAFLLHCPWRGGTGISFQQFAFHLPQTRRVVVRGATAMKSENVTNSDGVTFRVFANGRKLLDLHQTNDVWRAFEFDLSSFRGTNVVLRFETDPGPRNDASFDYGLWGDRELVLEGYRPAPAKQAFPPPMAISNLWSGQAAEVAPRSGYPASASVTLSNDVAILRYSGTDGVLEYAWSPPKAAADGLFGAVTLSATLTGGKTMTLPLAGTASLGWTETATPVAQGWQRAEKSCTLWRTFKTGATLARVQVTGEIVGKSLVLSARCDEGKVTVFDPGVWGPFMRRRQIPTPYYTGSVWFLPRENLFLNQILDWTASDATVHQGTRAEYSPRTDGTRVPLRERVIFTAAWRLEEVLPNPPNPPSPWRDFLADKLVLDIWGGRFGEVAGNLKSLAGYGLTNCVALIHDWQRSGYDNALPAHFPANAHYGGDAGMSNLVAVGTSLGIRCALHENYVDYYPNYEGFQTNDLALDSAGKPQLAWYNPGTRIQSFAIQPNAILRLAEGQSPEIHKRYATHADYLDVHSAVPPWFHVDQRAGQEGASGFGRVWGIHRQLWAYERKIHDGPVFGEGNNHWYWSGLLDGVEAQFGSGWPGNGGFTAPLAVDFDLLKIHPLQFNHGLGYYSRWWPTESYQTNWGGGSAPMAVLDRYRAQEVAFGHAGFLDSSVYANLPVAWLEHHLLTPVMARYGAARPIDIRYERAGGWVDPSTVIRSDDNPAWQRVLVRYENGLTVTVNGASNTLSVAGWRLPQWGWLAEAPGFHAGTVLRDGVITDFADTGDSLFVNARAAVDWNLSNYRRVQPGVSLFQQTGPRSFKVTYRWDVRDSLGKNYHCFVHFCIKDSIKAQQDHTVAAPVSQWAPGSVVEDGPWEVTLPAQLPEGDYDWGIGLYDAGGTGERVFLQGPGSGDSRVRLGTLRVADGGARLTFIPETGSSGVDPAAWYGQHLNSANAVVDFADLRTDGSVRLTRDAGGWRLQTWPRRRGFLLELSGERFPPPQRVESVGGSASEVTPILAGSRWKLPLNGAGEYRWRQP